MHRSAGLFTETIIYEMQVRGFTAHPNSGIAPSKRGTYAGPIEKIPYLQNLGVSAVELLPVFAFDEQDVRRGLNNYWGYQSLSFFASHQGYSSRRDPRLQPLDKPGHAVAVARDGRPHRSTANARRADPSRRRSRQHAPCPVSGLRRGRLLHPRRRGAPIRHRNTDSTPAPR
jgi:hypothetical protein